MDSYLFQVQEPQMKGKMPCQGFETDFISYDDNHNEKRTLMLDAQNWKAEKGINH